ncbi:superoxide dismutase[Cu-Zn] [Tsukamurella soli]
MTKRMSRALILPVVVLAGAGLAACSTNEKPATSVATAPAVVTTAQQVPEAGLNGGGSADAGSSAGAGESSSTSTSTSASATLKKVDGSNAGTATFTEKDGVVVIDVKATGLPAGFHGLHIHSVGKCEASSTAATGGPAGAFLSSGGDFQVSGHTGHPASGDLVSIYVNSNGTGETVTTTNAFKVSELTSGVGTSIVIHADADNFGNVPASEYSNITPGQSVPDMNTLDTGDAGARIACGVIKAG